MAVSAIIDCSHPATKTGEDSLATQPAVSSQAKNDYYHGTLTIDPSLLKKYQKACRSDTASYDKKFISNFLSIVKGFNGRILDTTILTTGNLDGEPAPDSIFTRVYFDADSIFVDSKWVKDNNVRWEDKYADPYTELDADLLDSGRNTWVFFAIGIVYGPPDFLPRNALDSGALSSAYAQGVENLKRIGVNVDTDQYKVYLRDFKGGLLAYGQPESREGLWIWYKPAGRLITYYRP